MLPRSIRSGRQLFGRYQRPLLRSLIVQPTLQHSLNASKAIPMAIVRYQSGSPSESAAFKPKGEQGELLIEFTCNVCDHRSQHNMSKQAYEHGTVLIQCPECKNRHLIADHLGFIRDEGFNLEDYLGSEGEEVNQNVLQFNKVPDSLKHSTGQEADEQPPKEEKILDLEGSEPKVIKDNTK
ncbi:hypothetical protein PVL30_005013 [Lodderomyces elongisporus]|uniref:uncharacterized protein n=1 Tax=Lodderomyces elongisporus TaxID=36914 RepID=UPI002925B94D|nr:uncharacterized protein PVL30_005013 [Lodderomyces elongisporus]WLF81216.1 hypothetical protein PVL30_005013 [Lodderomyces elongisporus]